MKNKFNVMTHQEFTTEIAFNHNILGRHHKGAKIAAITIIEKSIKDEDIEAEIKRILKNPEVPAKSVIGRDYNIYVVFKKYEYSPEEKVEYLYIDESLSDLELEELFFF